MSSSSKTSSAGKTEVLIIFSFMIPATCGAITLVALMDRKVQQMLDVALGVLPAVLYLLVAAVGVGVLAAFVRLVVRPTVEAGISWAQRDVIQVGEGQAPLVSGRRGVVDPLPPAVRAVGQLGASQAAAGVRLGAASARNMVHAAQYAPGWASERLAAPVVEDVVDGKWERLPDVARVQEATLPGQPSLLVGEGASGQVALGLHNLGNVVIGGLPGSGKSELMASMMAGIIRQTPHGRSIQFAVIDTKMVDFGMVPADLATLWAPVATDVGDGVELVQAVRAETQRRFGLLASEGARSLQQFRRMTGEELPYLVLFVDELADWAGDREFNAAALEIGRKGRAAGVGMVLATQRPSADVVASSLRAVAGAGIAFRMRTVHDSRTILGDGGAEDIPANRPGRCLLARGELRPVQAYFAGIDGRNGQASAFDRLLAAAPRRSDIAGERSGFWGDIGAISGKVVAVEGGSTQTAQPVFDVESRAEYSPEQVAEIRRLYAALGSINAVTMRLYDQRGGYWFYRVREVLEDGGVV